MIDEYEEVFIDSNFVPDLNCELEDGKHLRDNFKQNLSDESSNNLNNHNKDTLLNAM